MEGKKKTTSLLYSNLRNSESSSTTQRGLGPRRDAPDFRNGSFLTTGLALLHFTDPMDGQPKLPNSADSKTGNRRYHQSSMPCPERALQIAMERMR